MKQVTLAMVLISVLFAGLPAFSTANTVPQGGPGVYRQVTVTAEQDEALKTCEKLGVSESDLIITGKKVLSESQRACLVAKSEAGIGACGKTFGEAKAALKEFRKVCNEAKYGDLKKCVETAVACADEDPDSTLKETAENQKLYRELGLDIDSNKQAVKSTCARYGRKDYDTQKGDIATKLREAKKDLEASQKERAKAAEEYSTNKRRQVEKQGRVQEQMSKLVDENQKVAQERAQDMSKGIIESEKEQASVRVQNIQAQGTIAKIQGQRANDLSRLTDSMISSNCMAKMDLLLRQWAIEGAKSVRGSAALFQANADKKRRIQGEHQACIEQATGARRQLRKEYSAQVLAVKEQIKGNDRQAASLEEQKSRQASDYQAFLARQGVSQTEAYNRANAELAAIGQENTEIEGIRSARGVEAEKAIKESANRITELSSAMDNLGSEPRGEKLPNDAITHAQEFLTTVETFNDSAACKGMVPVMEKMLSKGILSAVKAIGAPKTTDSTSGSTSTGKSDAR